MLGAVVPSGRGALGVVGGRRAGLSLPWRRAVVADAGVGARGRGGERVPHRGGGVVPAAMDSRVSELFGGCCRPAGSGAGGALRGRGGAAPGGGGSKAKKKNGRSRGGKTNNPPYLPPEVSSPGRAKAAAFRHPRRGRPAPRGLAPRGPAEPLSVPVGARGLEEAEGCSSPKRLDATWVCRPAAAPDPDRFGRGKTGGSFWRALAESPGGVGAGSCRGWARSLAGSLALLPWSLLRGLAWQHAVFVTPVPTGSQRGPPHRARQ